MYISSIVSLGSVSQSFRIKRQMRRKEEESLSESKTIQKEDGANKDVLHLVIDKHPKWVRPNLVPRSSTRISYNPVVRQFLDGTWSSVYLDFDNQECERVITTHRHVIPFTSTRSKRNDPFKSLRKELFNNNKTKRPVLKTFRSNNFLMN